MADAPIGIFDSGYGGLTVARAVLDQLPHEPVVYLADTARQVTSRAVQYHGGLGVALEHDAQLFYRRARAYPLLAGAPRHLLRGLGTALTGQAG